MSDALGLESEVDAAPEGGYARLTAIRRATRPPGFARAVIGRVGALGFLFAPLLVVMTGAAVLATPSAEVEFKRAALVALIGLAGIAGWPLLGSGRLIPILNGAVELSAVLRLFACVLLFVGIDSLCPDSFGYDREARQLIDAWSFDRPRLEDIAVGTRAVPYVYAALYGLVGPTMLGGFVASAFIGTLGAWGFCRAAQIGVPGRHVSAYWLAVLFLPSLVIWPTILGKDSLVFGGLGLVAYGAAGSLRGLGPRFPICLLGGLGAVAAIRPHIAVAVMGGWILSHARVPFLWRRARRGSLAVRLLVFAVGGVLATIFATTVVGSLDPARALEALTRFSSKTSYGGSAIAPAIEEQATASEAVPGIVTGAARVLLRPYLWEATKPAIALAAVEVVLVFALLLVRGRSALREIACADGQYLRFALIVGLLTMAMIGVAGNLGIIVRHRAMVWPFLLLPFLITRPRQTGEISQHSARPLGTTSSADGSALDAA